MLQFLREHVRIRDGCHHWAGALHASGYPKVVWSGQEHMARRLLAQLTGRVRSRRDRVWTICGEKLCMNEEHMRIGTQRTALRAAAERGVLLRGPARALSSAAAWRSRAKMGIDRSGEVMQMLSEGATHAQIAARFGVSKGAVGKALSRWARTPELAWRAPGTRVSPPEHESESG